MHDNRAKGTAEVEAKPGEQKTKSCGKLAPVTWCEVVFKGSDGKPYSELVEGASLYDAAFRALEQVVRLWWFDPQAPIVVRTLQQVAEYRLTARQVHEWGRRRNRGTGGGAEKADRVH